MRCDVIAQGILQAAKELELKIPIIVRLQGELGFKKFCWIVVSINSYYFLQSGLSVFLVVLRQLFVVVCEQNL